MDARGALVAARTMAQAMDHGMTAGMTIAVSSRSSAKLLLVLIECPAELGCKDDCERLAAGNEARDDGREQRRRIIPEAACKGFKFPMDAVQKSRPLENAGEGSGEADDGGDMEHG